MKRKLMQAVPAPFPIVKVESNPSPSGVECEPPSESSSVEREPEEITEQTSNKRAKTSLRLSEEEEDRLDAELLSRIQAELPLPFTDLLRSRAGVVLRGCTYAAGHI